MWQIIWPGDLDLWPWKSIRFQILWRTKYVPSLVKIHWRMLILECSQGCCGRTDGSVTISLRNFVGEGIKRRYLIESCIILVWLTIIKYLHVCWSMKTGAASEYISNGLTLGVYRIVLIMFPLSSRSPSNKKQNCKKNITYSIVRGVTYASFYDVSIWLWTVWYCLVFSLSIIKNYH